MKIKTLLNKANLHHEIINNHYVNEIKDDSRDVTNNDIFFAINGGQTDGRNYINEAINKGAKTIIYEGEIKCEKDNINYLKVYNIRSVLALFCKIL